jgi:hypothetical protein
MFEVAEADLELKAGFVHVKASPGIPQIARRARRRKRSAFRAYDGEVGRVARAPGAPRSPLDGEASNSLSLHQRKADPTAQTLPFARGHLPFSVLFLW